jgi:hypothetical protein
MRSRSANSIAKNLYVSDFSVIDVSPPFVTSIAGIVASVEPEAESASGVPMKAFKLLINEVDNYLVLRLDVRPTIRN